jgi:hypothetical protein
MHPQLQAVADEFVTAQARLHRLAATTPEESWSARPDPARWSAGECVDHLNLTSGAFLPLLRGGLEQATALGAAAPARYRRDPIGWLLWRTAGPPVRYRVRTTAPFVPAGSPGRADLVATFDRLQADQLACVTRADGLPLGRVKVTSPFDPRARYNLYACLTILPRHQHRHLWQAEQALERLRGPG